jgi:hypothetical protein
MKTGRGKPALVLTVDEVAQLQSLVTALSTPTASGPVRL